MYELIRISEHDYYIDCPSRMGIVKTGETEAVMIDSGNDKDAAKKALRRIEENGWKLTAVYNTHAHADHIGGNKLLQDRTGCRCFAQGIESVYAANVLLESSVLYGANPHKELRNKFLMAQESNTEKLTAEVLPEGWKIINLPGHSPEMVGYITADGNAYIGDVVSSQESNEKYGIMYLWDIEESLKSLEYIKTVEAENFIPAHAPVTQDITELADINIAAIEKVKNRILELCSGDGLSFDQLLSGLFEGTGLVMNAGQHVLTGSTVRSYLTYLTGIGKAAYEFRDNIMYWKTI